MRLAHLTDLHLTDGSRLADQARVLGDIVTQAVDLGVQATILSGDIYGRTVPHRSTPAERAVLYPLVRTLAKLGPVVIVVGNHDYPGDLDTLAQVGGGMDWPVVVANRPRVIKLQTSGPDLHVYAVPWPTTKILLHADDAPKGPDAQRQLASQKLDQLLTLWGSRVTSTRATDPDTVHVLAAHCMVNGGRTSGGEVLSGREIELSRMAMERIGVDYGALGHLHFQQMVADRCWYGGDPYPVDFGETEAKGWNLVDFGWLPPLGSDVIASHIRPRPIDTQVHKASARGQHPVCVTQLPTTARRWITHDYVWDADTDAGPRWVQHPAQTGYDDIDGAYVRARLTVAQQWRASCPWDEALQDLRSRGAYSIQDEVDVVTVNRVRAPEVAKAETPLDKMVAYWDTLETTPDTASKAAATALLHELQTTDDEAIEATTAAN